MTLKPGDYSVLLGPGPPSADAPRLELPPGFPLVDAAEVLEALFAANDGIDQIAVVAGTFAVGVASRDAVEPPGRLRGVGDGDGASLPGRSAAYELLRYVCRECSQITYRIHVDPRDPPTCVNGHGPLDRPR
ncbi:MULTISPECIES: hypothetical protein [unclassified Microbispora]|uniref:hypothetical protein n=1 Tax=unclassified Microbispora TaxID=2614687 RepID=UPI0016045ED9|nr:MULTISPECIES: hypothetical protein [unclassified Microbispora]